jgi:hypothetical protein
MPFMLGSAVTLFDPLCYFLGDIFPFDIVAHCLMGNLALFASTPPFPPTQHWSLFKAATSLISSGAGENHGLR